VARPPLDVNRASGAKVRPIQIPMAIGSLMPGVDRGAAVLDHTLRRRLADRQQDSILERILDSEHIAVAPLQAPDARLHPGIALNLDDVATACDRLGRAVAASIGRGELALTLGGDHAASIGSVAGASMKCNRLAVIWIDAHADMNWPEVSPSGRLHGMGLGASMGRGPAVLTGLMSKNQKVHPTDVIVVGARLLDPGEEAWFRAGECWLAAMPDIDRLGLDQALDLIFRHVRESGADAVHVSFDLDALDPLEAPGTGSPVKGGFTYREASRIFRALNDSDLPIRSIDWMELNPSLDPSGGSSDIAADLLAAILGERIFRSTLLTDCEAR
jgi:arginase